jgi:asparagine synthase (glutamine-hydrolysing)
VSGILGIVTGDGAPVDPLVLARMTAAMKHRGPDGVRQHVAGPAGLVHLRFDTTPEDLAETQPLVDDASGLVLVMDGRIDNRDELRAALGSDAPRDAGDAALVLAAHRRWGDDFPARLIGDFAVVIWDGARRRLFAARDVFGTRPLHYAVLADGTFLWASELGALLAHPRLPRQPNEGMIGELLAIRICSVTETLWRDVSRLPPAHRLILSDAGVTTACYWQPDYTRRIRYRNESDYAEHLSELLRTVMTAYLRSTGPVGVYLSGGFDSSSVVATIEHLRRTGSGPVPACEIASLVFPGMACDERAEVEACARFWGLTPHLHDATHIEEFPYLAHARERGDFPGFPNGTMLVPLQRHFESRGIRVVLTGMGGDDWFETTRGAVADALLTADPFLFGRALLTSVQSAGLAQGVRQVARGMLAPFCPPWLKANLRKWGDRPLTPRWIGSEFARRCGLEERLAAGRPTRAPGSLDSQGLIAQSAGADPLQAMESCEYVAAGVVDERNPLCDRRIVEFAIALPFEQRRRGAQSRIVLREAVRGLLPERTRQRTSGAEFNQPSWQRVRHALASDLRGDSFDRFAVVRNGWVRRESLEAQLAAAGQAPNKSVWPLWMASAIEIWYRATGEGEGRR